MSCKGECVAMTLRPNVIFIVLDALRSMNLSIYGYNQATSPTLENLSRLGVVFLNAYSTTDQTDPSFTSMLSGRYPLVHGIIRHGFDLSREHLAIFNATQTKLLPEFLAENGYITIGIDWLGRWHRRGFNIYGPASLFVSKRMLGRIPKSSSIILKILTHATDWDTYLSLYKLFRSLGYCYDHISFCIVDAAMNLIKKHVLPKKKPFFILMHLWDTHTPFYDIPKFLLKEFYDGTCKETIHEMVKRIKNEEWRKLTLKYHLKGIKCVDQVEPYYNAAIKHADRAIGKLVEFLKDHKLFDDTIIIITGDHGDNLIRDNIFIGHGGLFQRVIKIPLIMLGLGIPQNRKVTIPVQHVDIVPTLLDIIGIKIPKGYYMDGYSMLEIFETDSFKRNFVFVTSSTARKRYALIEDSIKFVYSPTLYDAMDKFGGIWFRDVKELYDLNKDQDDVVNIVNEYPDIAREMEKKISDIVTKLIRIRTKLMISSVISTRIRLSEHNL